MTTATINKQQVNDPGVVGQNTGHPANAVVEKTQEVVGQVRTRLSTVLQSTKAAAQRAQTGAVSAVKATDQCVCAHPYETIGVFFGLGLLAGVLLARK